MTKRKIVLLVLILVAMASLADLIDFTKGNQVIERGNPGEDAKSYKYKLEIEGEEKSFPYTIEVKARPYSEEEKAALYEKAEEEILETVFPSSKLVIREDLPLKGTYANKRVKAEWTIEPYGLISREGEIDWKKYEAFLEERGESIRMVEGQQGLEIKICVELSLVDGEEKEKQLLEWTPVLLPKENVELPQILYQLEKEFKRQEGEKEVILPTELLNRKVRWKQEYNYYLLKTVIFLSLIGVLWKLRDYEKAFRDRQEKEKEMMCDYPEIVGKFAIFVGTGMTIQQAIRKLLELYAKGQKKRFAYEEFAYTMNQIEEGEAQRIAFQKLADRIGLSDYRRFIRMLIQHQEKGGANFVEDLNYEMEQAYRIQRNNVKKLAEEAGTKLLFPMMLMLGIVLAIVIMPALLSLHI